MKDLKKLKKRLYSLAATFLVTCYTMATAYADNPQPAGNAAPAAADTGGFNSVIDTVLKWGGTAGLAVIMVGGIMFAFAFKNNDPEQKTSAIQTMVAGIIVAAVCGLGRAGFGL